MSSTDRISLIRGLAAKEAPYLSAALFRLELRPTDAVRTMAASRWWVLYYNVAACNGDIVPDAKSLIQSPLTTGEASALMTQQVWHLLREHPRRRYGRLYGKWAVAGDIEINDSLPGLPKGSLMPSNWKLKEHGLAETYYEDLPDGSEGASQGSAAHGVPQEWEEPRPDAPDATEEKQLREYTAKEIQAANSRGTVSAGLDVWAAEILRAPRMDLGKILACNIRQSVGSIRGRSDYTYSRPSRKPTEGFILPGMRGSSISAALIRDTSGSMGSDDLGKAVRIGIQVFRQLGVEPAIIDCDAAAVVRGKGSLASRTLRGGGGTDMVVAIDKALSLRPRPSLIVTVTDGYTPWPKSMPEGVRHICVLTQATGTRPPFGSVVKFFQNGKQ